MEATNTQSTSTAKDKATQEQTGQEPTRLLKLALVARVAGDLETAAQLLKQVLVIREHAVSNEIITDNPDESSQQLVEQAERQLDLAAASADLAEVLQLQIHNLNKTSTSNDEKNDDPDLTPEKLFRRSLEIRAQVIQSAAFEQQSDSLNNINTNSDISRSFGMDLEAVRLKMGESLASLSLCLTQNEKGAEESAALHRKSLELFNKIQIRSGSHKRKNSTSSSVVGIHIDRIAVSEPSPAADHNDDVRAHQRRKSRVGLLFSKVRSVKVKKSSDNTTAKTQPDPGGEKSQSDKNKSKTDVPNSNRVSTKISVAIPEKMIETSKESTITNNQQIITDSMFIVSRFRLELAGVRVAVDKTDIVPSGVDIVQNDFDIVPRKIDIIGSGMSGESAVVVGRAKSCPAKYKPCQYIRLSSTSKKHIVNKCHALLRIRRVPKSCHGQCKNFIASSGRAKEVSSECCACDHSGVLLPESKQARKLQSPSRSMLGTRQGNKNEMHERKEGDEAAEATGPSSSCFETVLTVVDLGSSSKGGGVAVNNVRVMMADLKHGDVIRFGGCRNLVMGCVSNETESQHPTPAFQVFTFRVIDLNLGSEVGFGGRRIVTGGVELSDAAGLSQLLGPVLHDRSSAREHFNVLCAASLLNQETLGRSTEIGNGVADSLFNQALQEQIPFNHWSTFITTHLAEHV